MKKAFSILLFVISSQILLAHPGPADHSHNTFMGEWAWVLVPAIALIVLAWKFGSKARSKKSED